MNPVEKQVSLRESYGTISVFTHESWDIVLKNGHIWVLEFEDVLFHHDSAVMMPENPKGKSHKDGTADDSVDKDDQKIKAQQEAVQGVKALALVYKEFELNPNRAILVAGHTDSSGKVPYNYTLADLRARNVLALLTCNMDEWLKTCAEKQKVEDYQQILTHYAALHSWKCNPKGMNDRYNSDTRQAIEGFIADYNEKFVADYENKKFACPPGLEILDRNSLIKKIEGHPKKWWPAPLWKAVFHLYSDEICTFMRIGIEELDRIRKAIPGDKKGVGSQYLHWDIPYVSCGESFPIDDAYKDNYRSQCNRRVEILFFEKDEAPPDTAFKVCKNVRNRKHNEKECPLWKFERYEAYYIVGSDLNAYVYDLRFVYFDRVLGELRELPEVPDLDFSAYEHHKKRGINKLNGVQSKYENNVYRVKIPFIPPLPDPDLEYFHLEFTTTDAWIFTESASPKATPVAVKQTKDEINKLPKKDRLKYYDLPAKWSSDGYWTRYYNDMETGEWFKVVLTNKLKLKPFGTGVTKPEDPLIFSLDDIVLTDKDGKPIVWTPGADEKDRIAIFCNTFAKSGPSSDNLSEIGLYKPGIGLKLPCLTERPASGPASGTEKNYIHDYPSWTRLVVAQGNLFDVFDARTSDAPGQVVGARAGMMYVNSVSRAAPGAQLAPRPGLESSPSGCFIEQPFFEQQHDQWNTTPKGSGRSYPKFKLYTGNANYATDTSGTGRFDLALLRCCSLTDDREETVIFSYLRYFFDFEDAETPAAIKANQKAYIIDAVSNTMRRWNGPENFYEIFHSGNVVILPEDPKKKLEIDPARNIRLRPIFFVQSVPQVNSAHFKISIRKGCRAHMGSHNGLGQLSEIDHQRSLGPSTKWHRPIGALTIAHETGHALSLGDEYTETSSTASYYAPGFYSYSPGSPYLLDEPAIMQTNRYVRARCFWFMAPWANSVLKEKDGYFVQMDTKSFRLPPHARAPAFSYQNFPLAQKIDHQAGSRGYFDMFLYAFGSDAFSNGGLVVGHNLTGIFVLIVKLKIKYHEDNFWRVYSATDLISKAIDIGFNQRPVRLRGKYYATGEVHTGTPRHTVFDKCLIHVSPRFLINNFDTTPVVHTPPTKAEENVMNYAKANDVLTPDGHGNYDPNRTKTAYGDLVAAIEDAFGHHFEIETRRIHSGSPNAAWDPANSRRLIVNCTSADWHTQVGDLIRDRFQEMLGMAVANASSVSSSNYLTIVQNLITTNAQIHSF